MATLYQLILLLCLMPAVIIAQEEGGESETEVTEEQSETVIEALTSALHIREIGQIEEIPGLYAQTLQGMAESATECGQVADTFYSRVDGTCNNLHFPLRGAAMSLQPRFFPNTYDDGCGHPRTVNRFNRPLPPAREVSRRCFFNEDDENPMSDFSQLVWQYGQFLAHDLTFVEPFEGMVHCCDFHVVGCPHPDLKMDGPCFPMDIDPDDAVFNFTNCLPFARSFAVNHFKVREMVNGVTSFLDASNVYGSSVLQSNDLRLFSRGLLKTFQNQMERLPTDETDLTFNACRQELLDTSTKCPEAGDGRANEQPGLGSIHTLFVEEHNFMARRLNNINPHWDDERVFQTARKIVIGIMQSITYNEFLPVVLGEEIMEHFGLNTNQNYRYIPTVDPSVHLEFSTASFRFGHALLNGINGLGEDLSNTFFVPITNPDDIAEHVLFQSNNTAHSFNNGFSNQIRELLFNDAETAGATLPGITFDLAARNIHRGRDHGIPTYTTVRDYCLDLLEDVFPDSVLDPYRTIDSCLEGNDGIYRREQDIDLFAGAVFEDPLPGAVLGPTFACLNALQFQKLKYGDRFFYTGTSKAGFSDDERAFLERSTLASILCDLDIPRDTLINTTPFLSINSNTVYESCRELRSSRRIFHSLSLFGDRVDGQDIQNDEQEEFSSALRLSDLFY